MVNKTTSSSTRKDALPDAPTYQDVGCVYHPSCLQCPEPTCIFDLPLSLRPTDLNYLRLGRLKAVRPTDNARSLMTRLNVSERTAYRLLATFRQLHPSPPARAPLARSPSPPASPA